MDDLTYCCIRCIGRIDKKRADIKYIVSAIKLNKNRLQQIKVIKNASVLSESILAF